MKTKDFYYKLDESLIAQKPLKNREASRLLVLDKKTGLIKHDMFNNIINYIDSSDCLVFNDTKVIPARIIGVKIKTQAKIELLLLKGEDDIWTALTRPARRVKLGDIITFENNMLKAECVEVLEEGLRRYKMDYEGLFINILDKIGQTPLPPYIHEKLDDKNRYQTIYAKYEGSAAAPTAGLHFTKEIIDKIIKKGVSIVYITLHVGLGTFRPVKVDDIKMHKMHKEHFYISEKNAIILNGAIKNNKRIISVGTTSTRTLESAFNDGFIKCDKETNIFIYPGYKFKVVDALITNFHLPESTLMMLVSSLAGRESIMNAYEEAQKERYRFFSFGDSMFIK